MTPSRRYVASRYEEAVDADLDMDEVRKYLLEHGIVRTPGLVAWEIEHTMGFIGYANKHPAKPTMDAQAFDMAVGHA